MWVSLLLHFANSTVFQSSTKPVKELKLKLINFIYPSSKIPFDKKDVWAVIVWYIFHKIL